MINYKLIIGIAISILAILFSLGIGYYFFFSSCNVLDQLRANCETSNEEDNENQPKTKLIIEKTIWSGWGDEPDVTKTTEEFFINDDNEIIILEGTLSSDIFELKVNQNDSKVTFSVNGLSVKVGDNINNKGIDLMGCRDIHNFELSIGESAELNTCTMDAGVTWVIKLEN
jgi:hypothetical protein